LEFVFSREFKVVARKKTKKQEKELNLVLLLLLGLLLLGLLLLRLLLLGSRLSFLLLGSGLGLLLLSSRLGLLLLGSGLGSGSGSGGGSGRGSSLLMASLVVDDGLHGREEKDLLDVVGVREEHGQAVDSETPTGGGRKTVLQGGAKVLVNHLGLVVSGGLVLGLLGEPLPLDEGVVQLGVGVAYLLGGNEELEPLSEAGLAPVAEYSRIQKEVINIMQIQDKKKEEQGRKTNPLARGLMIWGWSMMKVGEMQLTSRNSPTSLSSRRAVVLGALQSTLFWMHSLSRNLRVSERRFLGVLVQRKQRKKEEKQKSKKKEKRRTEYLRCGGRWGS